MAKHYPTKVNNTDEKDDYLSTVVNAVTMLEDMDFSYLSTGEQSKLTTACLKLHTIIEEVGRRMDNDILKQEVKGEQKEKLKEVNKRLKTLSPEELDKLLSTI